MSDPRCTASNDATQALGVAADAHDLDGMRRALQAGADPNGTAWVHKLCLSIVKCLMPLYRGRMDDDATAAAVAAVAG